jgi:ammonium transporter Rh
MLYHDRLRLRDVMFASLSGAVAISSGANLIINIGGVMLCSFFVGWISLSGYAYFSRFFNIYGLYDVAGINNLHGIPGLISGIYSAIFISVYTAGLNYLGISTTKGTRTNYEQGAYQIACLATSLAFGLAFGAITGSILRRLALYHKDQLFEDKSFWEILPAE